MRIALHQGRNTNEIKLHTLMIARLARFSFACISGTAPLRPAKTLISAPNSPNASIESQVSEKESLQQRHCSGSTCVVQRYLHEAALAGHGAGGAAAERHHVG